MVRRLLAIALLSPPLLAQDAQAPLNPPPNGPKRVEPSWHVIVNATVHVRPGEALAGADVELRDGVIVEVGPHRERSGPRVFPGEGLHVYAGFLDAFVEVEAPPPDPRAAGVHFNPRVTPQRSALLGKGVPDDVAKQLREMGFAAAGVAPKGGVLRGRGAVVSLAEPNPDPNLRRATLYRDPAFHAIAFELADREEERDPSSQMGAIALIRQSLLDAAWVASRGERNALTELLAPVPLLFDTADELEALRAAKIAREFGRPAILVGSGTEFRRLDAIARDGLPLIVPLAFPRRPDVDSIGAVESVELRDLMTWEQAPTNPRRLDARGLLVALTTAKLERRSDFPARLREAVRHGLTPERALAMLTTNPARILGVEDRLGSVEAGKLANLVVADGPLFAKGTRILDVWIDGVRHGVAPAPFHRLEGLWALALDPPIPESIVLEFAPENRLVIRRDEAKTEALRLLVTEDRVSFAFEHEPFGSPGVYTLTGVFERDRLSGDGVRATGERFRWIATRTAGPKREEVEEPPAEVPETLGLPFGPYAVERLPEQPEVVAVRGGTVWTCGPLGVLPDGVVIARRGTIEYVGTDASRIPANALVVDATGKHVTPGLFDCHSHTGISKGVNESGQAVTAEVRIADVTDPDAVAWYRELAGGLTCVHSLHGSANPIGGQSCVNKIRWGCVHPDDMHLEGAPGGIKFALGENVKQSNWGDRFTTRYPQTRMGVETILRDRFFAAREYRDAWRAAAERGGPAPRRDLELEALAEVLEGTRLVHCHSYRQDEILMLCRVAAEFGFRIGTFQHVLEGYKVADAIREHAIGGSSFSDWWAYKVEVQDAIPENGAIMHAAGVCVSFNSDSDELARRMNVEAAKAVKYGGVPREEALKFVTWNAARQLRVENRVGSLEPGKDADFVVWSADPLSTLARCEQTWIDGRAYFTLEQDRRHRERIEAERRRLVQKALRAKDEKREEEEAGARGGDRKRLARFLELLRRGHDPAAARCGVCGCEEE